MALDLSINPGIMQEIMAREKMDKMLKPRVEARPPNPKPLGSTATSIIGGLADAGSTYRMLKNGSSREANSLVKGLNNSPAKIGGLALGMIPAIHGIRKLVAKKFPRAAEVISANQGALQLGYGALNSVNSKKRGESSSAAFRSSLEKNRKLDLSKPK